MRQLNKVIFVILLFLLSAAAAVVQAQTAELDRANSLNEKITQFYRQGLYAEAIPLAQEVLTIREKALGPDHLDVADSLNNLATVYQAIGAYGQAEPLYKRALAIYEKALGSNHPDVAWSLNNLAALYRAAGSYAQAEPLLQRALAIREKALGPDHPDVAATLNSLALLYDSMGSYDRAEPLYKRALAIREKILGPDHLDVAASLNNLAALYKSTGAYAQAEPLFLRALTIYEKVLGPDHPNVATMLSNLANLYQATGAYAQAEPLYKRALAIRRKILGPDHPDVAAGLNNLATLYYDTGDYAQAEPLYKKALAIRQKILGRNHPDVAASMISLAVLYYQTGAFAQAEPLYKRALAIYEKTLGPEHPEVATCLNNLAELYRATGANAQAEKLYKQALSIREKTLGPNHPDVGESLNSLAALYYNTGAYAQAEPLLKRALAIREKALGPEHPDVALTLNNLAALYSDLGQYAQAEPLFQRALAIREKTLGPGHPDVALTLNNLATLYSDLGKYVQAEPLFQRALAVWEKALGPNHPHVAASLNNLAMFLSAQDQEKEALPFFLRAQRITEKLIDQVMGFTSEDRKIEFLAQNQLDFEAALNVAAFHLNQDQQVRREGLDLWLRRKGVILEAQKRYQEALFYTDNPEAVRLAQELAQVRARLSKLAFGGPGKEGLDAYRRNLAEIENEKERLEAELARFSQSFARRQVVKKADSRQVAAALPTNTVLLEFVQLRKINFKAKGGESKWSAPHYLAFVLPAGQPDKIELIHLGEARPIDEAITAFKKAATDLNNPRRLAATDESRRLYDLVFAKIAPYLGAATEVFISPDGNLNLIPFEVLQGPDGKFLIEKYTFNYLASGRDILGFGQLQGQSGKSILIGDPDFDLTPSAKAIQLKSLGLKAEEGGLRSTELRGLLFTPLPNTRLEIEQVADILGQEHCDLYLGDRALEEVLLQVRSPRILHISTHGFFLKDEDLARLIPGPDSRGFAVSPFSDRPKAQALKIENPLLRSGLALAGANGTMAADRLTAGDGLFTAEKVLGLKLIGTEVVVLSACSTGLGDVRRGEGVYGLRRAFVQAGTQGLVMSMWSVPDKETQELMVQFYQNLRAGLPRSQALRQAALKEMQTVRGRHGQAYPMFWGAFVFLGDPGRK